METAPIPQNEAERLHALHEYSILDTLPEAEYDDITKLASQICGTPISSITLVDQNRQWFKSKIGPLSNETPRDISFCGHAILEPRNVFTVNDARQDARFKDNPLVTGSPQVIFYAGVPLVTPDGLPVGTLCVIDNTPKDLSPEQVEALRSLSHQVVSLFELRKSKILLEKMAAELRTHNEELERFAHVAAHDIKSPLANISSLAQIVLSDYSALLPENAQELLKMLDQSSDTLRRLVDGILAHSKADAVLSSSQSLVRVRDIMQKTISLLNTTGEVEVTYDTNGDEIYVNPVALQQILLNLVANAIKYNDKPVIQISMGFFETHDDYHFYVADNGSGIHPNAIDRIFRIFEVVASEDRFGQRGTGIGLSTVKKLVEGMGGTITVESVVGEGSRFNFTLSKFNFT